MRRSNTICVGEDAAWRGTQVRDDIMPSFLKSSFFRRFVGGFLLGTIGVAALQPAEAGRFVTSHIQAVR
jgi:hypothetical protein